MSGPRITITAVRERYERARSAGVIKRYVQDYVDAVWKVATRDFVLATARAIHVDTGMSMASLFALASEVGVKGEVEKIMRSKGPCRPKRGNMDAAKYGMPDNAIEKSVESGAWLGTKAYTLAKGDPSLSRWVFRLRFDIRVLQWAFHEDMWQALVEGRGAFEATFNRAMSNFFPSQLLSDYINKGIKPVKISVDRFSNSYGDEGE